MLKNYSKIKVDEAGDKFYFSNKRNYHRLDGPAIEWSNGSKYWYINDKQHRNIDSCVEWPDGEKSWFFKGKRHRVGGSYISEYDYWCINDEEYIKEDYFNKVWDI